MALERGTLRHDSGEIDSVDLVYAVARGDADRRRRQVRAIVAELLTDAVAVALALWLIRAAVSP